jgi:hypothetical protein
MKALKTAG